MTRELFDLLFADDVVLFAQQPSDLKKMLSHLSAEASKYGLQINFDKTKVLARNDWAAGLRSIAVGSQSVSILD